jgi:hypothetical protein
MSSLILLSLLACSGDELADQALRPSMTQLRTGKVVVDNPPVIPEARYIPGIVIRPEDYDYSSQTGRRRTPSIWERARTDLSRMLDLEDPAALEKHQDPGTYPYTTGYGSLIDENAEGDLTFDDVEQGAIGDCYLVAALSAVLYTDVDRYVRDGLIREVKDEDGALTYYAVRFYDAWGEPQDIQVDAELVRKSGKPLYARSMDTSSDQEEWAVSLVEKAYAQWHGGYEEIGNGGYAGDMMQALTGSNATYRTVEYLSDDSIVSSIADAIENHRAVVAGTFGEDDGVDYSGTNIYAYHAYSVLGVIPAEGGEEAKITLRNPWGSVEPAGNGEDDGIFDLPLTEFRRLYTGLTLGGDSHADYTAPAAVSNLKIEELVDGKALVSFTATGDDGTEGLAASYDLRLSTEPLTDDSFYSAERITLAHPQAPGATEHAEIEDLTTGVSYYVAIKVEDESGNISSMSNVIEDEDIEVKVGEQFFDFESDTDDWTTEGLFHLTDTRSASASHSFWFGDPETGDYATGERAAGTLTGPIIDLADMAYPTLLWEQLLDVEEGQGVDQARLVVATEDGGYEDWTTVWEKDGISDDFTLAEADLSAYAGQRIQLRFAFDSVDDQGNTGAGWFIDDVWLLD